jgi:O-antigen ligase
MPADAVTIETRSNAAREAHSAYDRLLLGALLLVAFFAPVSISAAEAAGALMVLLWSGKALTGRVRLPRAAFIAPLVIFMALSIISIAFSLDPFKSLYGARVLLAFALVPVVPGVVDSLAKARAVLAALAAGGIVTACWGIVQVILGIGGGDSGRRLTGFLGHYMTAGAALVMIVLALLAVILLAPGRREKLAATAAVVLPLAALGLTQSRNAYVGLAVGCVVVLFLWRPGVVALLPFALSLGVLLSPPMIRERIFSIGDLEDASIRNRFEMLERGAGIVADYPLFGAGLQQVQELYPRYKRSPASHDISHLHNNLLQIAAERGIPAAAAWLWFIAALFLATAGLARAQGSEPWLKAIAAAACGVVAAIFTAGMFEYNFGDTEVLIVLLIVVSLPFGIAARLSPTADGDEI